MSTANVAAADPHGAWTATFGKPVVAGIAPAAAAAMNAAISAAVERYLSDFASQVSAAGARPAASEDEPSTLSGSYSVAYASPALLSLRFRIAEYIAGAAHPTELVGGINFLVRSAAVVALSSLFASPAAGFEVLSAQSRRSLVAQLGPDMTDFIDPGTAPVAASFDQAWAFTAAGLEITFPQYAVAPGAAGTPVVVVPWPALAKVLSTSGPAAQFRS